MLAVAAAELTRTPGAVVSMAEPPVCAPIDANGNLTSDGARALEWDARNQLLAVNVGTHRSEFTYDGEQRRVRIVEKENSVVQSDTKVLWCEMAICEERDADGVTVTRRPFTLSEHVAGVARFFGVDHLGSVGDVTDTTSAVVGRYAFDPWGRRTLTVGTDMTSVAFTGHQRHSATGLSLTWYRGYDSELGRWISEDPAGLIDGPNRNAYVGNNPLNRVDPTGLSATTAGWPWLKVCVGVGSAISAIAGAAAGVIFVQCGDGCDLSDRNRKRGRFQCIAKCHINNFSNVPNAPEFVHGIGWGNSEAEAQLAAEKDANRLVPRGTYKRHCQFKCEKR